LKKTCFFIKKEYQLRQLSLNLSRRRLIQFKIGAWNDAFSMLEAEAGGPQLAEVVQHLG